MRYFILGAFLINILLPNVTQQVVNAAETSVFNATGMSFDFNGDGSGGKAGQVVQNKQFGNVAGDMSGVQQSGAVGGFK